MSFTGLVDGAGLAVEIVGVAILVAGVAGVLLASLTHGARHGWSEAHYRTTRRRLGRVLLLGLEVLVAGDIIRTVAVRPTLTGVGVLAGIVLIRTFLSWAIEMETEGRLPWRAAQSGDTGHQ